MKDIYKLELLESVLPDNSATITRVPGGWVFGNMHSCCFVPFDNEFQNKEKTGDTSHNKQSTPLCPECGSSSVSFKCEDCIPSAGDN